MRVELAFAGFAAEQISWPSYSAIAAGLLSSTSMPETGSIFMRPAPSYVHHDNVNFTGSVYAARTRICSISPVRLGPAMKTMELVRSADMAGS